LKVLLLEEDQPNKEKSMKIVLFLAIIATLMSCQKVENQESEAVQETKSEAIGPFKVVFNPLTNEYENTLSIDIQQAEGFFEYEILSNQKDDIQIIESSVFVSGCPSKNVEQTLFWFPDRSNKSVYQKLITGSIFNPAKNFKGSLFYSFKKLDGCSHINVKTKLRKNNIVSKIGIACSPANDIRLCERIAYCREKSEFNSFYEVEVQNQNGSIIIAKYYNYPGQDRKLTSLSTAKVNLMNTEVTYSGDNSNMILRIHRLNYEGQLSENINGTNFVQNHICEI
jgi:hypothetical protein